MPPRQKSLDVSYRLPVWFGVRRFGHDPELKIAPLKTERLVS
jgi:hypothetical protein